jgi:hypothetical protein
MDNNKPIALSDSQLAIVSEAAATIDPERRDVFLQRVAAMLRIRRRFTDADVADVCKLALCGLVQHAPPTAA